MVAQSVERTEQPGEGRVFEIERKTFKYFDLVDRRINMESKA
jgi:hypothetical protein